jgi:hypothetical protein
MQSGVGRKPRHYRAKRCSDAARGRCIPTQHNSAGLIPAIFRQPLIGDSPQSASFEQGKRAISARQGPS